ncbi:MAG TPA: hypothetical protein DD618_04795 [Acholeplasmatales bacterium]|nr:hypothetical protein [Acholeplasmatales bacterium]
MNFLLMLLALFLRESFESRKGSFFKPLFSFDAFFGNFYFSIQNQLIIENPRFFISNPLGIALQAVFLGDNRFEPLILINSKAKAGARPAEGKGGTFLENGDFLMILTI